MHDYPSTQPTKLIKLAVKYMLFGLQIFVYSHTYNIYFCKLSGYIHRDSGVTGGGQGGGHSAGLAKQSYRAGEDIEEGEERRGRKKGRRQNKKEKREKKKEKREKKGK